MTGKRTFGVRLLHRTSRSITPNTAGVRVLAQARQILAAAGNLVTEAATGHATLRIGHAWAAMGRHTREFQRRWAARYPSVDLELVHTNSATGGLAEGLCDIAVLRTAADGAAGPAEPGTRNPARRQDRDRRPARDGSGMNADRHSTATVHVIVVRRSRRP